MRGKMRKQLLHEYLVRFDRIHAQRGDEASHLGELVVLQCQASNLGGAHWRKVSGVTEKDGPLALLPLEEGVELAVGRVHGEVWDNITKAETAVGRLLWVKTHVGLGS
jgi:hypothetical protein